MMLRIVFPRAAAVLALACALVTPRLFAQNQIVLGDSSQEFQLKVISSTQLQLVLGACSPNCVVSGNAYGEGVFASSNGSYALATSSSNTILFTATSDDGGSSFSATQNQPIAFQYTSPQGDLTGTLTLTSLEQGNGSSTATLSGELAISGGSMAAALSSTQGEASFLLPVDSLSAALASGASLTAEVGYPSTLSLAPAANESCAACDDFVTGGGWIMAADGAKANFGVHGGLRDGKFWGHLEYNDHGSAPPMTVKSTSITNYQALSATTREIDGTAEVNGEGGFSFQVIVSDNDSGGEGPGPNHADQFSLTVSNGYAASGNLGGGDVEIHKGQCANAWHSDKDKNHSH